MKKMLAAVLALTVIPAVALAQEPAPDASRVSSLRLGAGGALPISDNLSELHGLGPSFSTGLDVPLATRLGLAISLSYSRFSLDGNALLHLFKELAPPGTLDGVEFDFRGGAHSFASGAVALKWTFATLRMASFYLNGGAGVYYSTLEDALAQPRDPDSGIPNVKFDLTSSAEGTSLGFQVGVGVLLNVSPNVDLFIEPQYVLILEDTEDTKYLPVRVGVSYNGLFR